MEKRYDAVVIYGQFVFALDKAGFVNSFRFGLLRRRSKGKRVCQGRLRHCCRSILSGAVKHGVKLFRVAQWRGWMP